MATAGRVSAGDSLGSARVLATLRLIATVGAGVGETGGLGDAMATGGVTAGAAASGRVSTDDSLGSAWELVILGLNATVGAGDRETGGLGGGMAKGGVTVETVAGGRVSIGGSLGSSGALVTRFAPVAGIGIGADLELSARIRAEGKVGLISPSGPISTSCALVATLKPAVSSWRSELSSD